MTATSPIAPVADQLSQRFEATVEPAPPRELRLRVDRHRFADAVRELHAAEARFVTLFVATSGDDTDGPEQLLTAALALRGELVLLRTPLDPDGRRDDPEIGTWWPAAAWAEAELVERTTGRRAAALGSRARLTRPDADRLDRTVDGLDAFAIPYGPVRSGVFEAIQFQIETGGETVEQLQTRPFFKHRGIESRFRGLTPEVAASVAERVAGIASCAYATAFAHAVERALEVAPPPRARAWRALYCELERIACHLDVIAKQAETTALYVGQARFQILKERAQRLRARLTGSRFGRGVIIPGGVRREGLIDPDELCDELDKLERDLARDRRLFLGTASMTDRLIGSGRLDRELVERFGAVGPLARGSGVSTDARHERPYGDYDRLGVRVVVHRDGDAMARVGVRFDELQESLRICRQAIDHLRRRAGGISASSPKLQAGELRAQLPAGAAGGACGWAEAPQGELLLWVQIDDGAVGRVHIASPSLRNFALFDHAFPKDVLTDFAFIEHSFGLTPAGADR